MLHHRAGWIFIAMLVAGCDVTAQRRTPDKHDDLSARASIPDLCTEGVYRNIIFRPGLTTLDPCAVKILDESAESLKRHPDMRIYILGHADNVGLDTRNSAELSMHRAQTVYVYLLQAGVDANQLMKPKGYGSTRPFLSLPSVESEDDLVQRAGNRRVELSPVD